MVHHVGVDDAAGDAARGGPRLACVAAGVGEEEAQEREGGASVWATLRAMLHRGEEEAQVREDEAQVGKKRPGVVRGLKLVPGYWLPHAAALQH